MEERIADIPAIVPLLERLAALTLPLVHMLDPMSVSNIFWALGTLRLSPAGQCHWALDVQMRAQGSMACVRVCALWWQLPSRVVACFWSVLSAICSREGQCGWRHFLLQRWMGKVQGEDVLSIEQVYAVDVEIGSGRPESRQLSVAHGVWR